MKNGITYDDLKEHEHLFTLAPPFILKRMAKRNSNIVNKFSSTIEPHLNNLTEEQRDKLDVILNSEVEELHNLLMHAYMQTRIKQYEILSNPKYKEFIELNLNELRKLI